MRRLSCLDELKRLEYRGYDSAGLCTLCDGQLQVRKRVGRVAGWHNSSASSP